MERGCPYLYTGDAGSKPRVMTFSIDNLDKGRNNPHSENMFGTNAQEK